MKPDLHPEIFLSDDPEEFRRRLLQWFDREKRSLPWRVRRSLYGTWISEVMLQQTTVAVVVPYWEKFMAVFGDVRSLAAADLAEVLAQWSGLGYYRRARQLHEAARIVVDRLGGELPRDRAGWLALPGIGPYASGAIASIGLNEAVPAVDANARRVLSRWLMADPQVQGSLKPAQLESIGGTLVDRGRPGDWNEAVMELGALICGAKDPRCPDCPMLGLCRAGTAGTAARIPPPAPAPETRRVRLGLLVLRWRDHVLLMPPGSSPVAVPEGTGAPVRADVSGLHKGLWGLPSTSWLPDPAPRSSPWPGSIWRPWLESLPLRGGLPAGRDPRPLGTFRHAITRYRLGVEVHGLRLPDALRVRTGGASGDRGIEELGVDSTSSGPWEVGSAGAVFGPLPGLDLPVSNLVRKGLSLAAKSGI